MTRPGLERLCKYGLRPPLAQTRLSEAPDGTILYQMKRRFSDGRHTLRFTPRELLLRLCALVPPPGFHMVRYAGIFSAHARGRFALTGRGLCDRPSCAADAPAAAPTSLEAARAGRPPGISNWAVSPALSALSPPPASPGGPSPPDDPGRMRRLDWATLLARTFGLDALTCPRCQGPMRLIAVIEDPAVARKILEHLGLPARPPPRGRPGWRGQQELPFDEPPEPELLDPPFDDTDPA